MRWTRSMTLVEAHAEGEIGRVVTGGVIDLPGGSVLEKLNHLNGRDDALRRFAVYEPRGVAQMTTNLLLPPSRPEADAAFIPMQADRSHAMSGSNAMCVTTVLLETGMLPMTEPQSTVVLDTAAGVIEAEAACRDGKVERVSLNFFPSFCEALDVRLEVEGLGSITADIAFGGVYYALVDVAEVGLTISPTDARSLVDVGNRIKAAARAQVSVRHPETPSFDSVDFVMFTEVLDPAARQYRNATIMPPGRVDRSPCGTGTAARLAAMHARGVVGVGEETRMRSAIDSEFAAAVVATTHVGDKPAVRTRVSGRAWIYGLHQIGVDPSDPFAGGFTMADTWGEGIEHQIPRSR
ncbi:MAG: proline racemase family protein [Pseudomonadota bacterium]